MAYTPDTAPSYVPRTKADQWCKVWNGVYDSALDDEDKSRDEAEARAFQAANSILSTRSLSIKIGDYVGWKNEKGVRLRGKAVRYINASPPTDDDTEEAKDTSTDQTPMLEVEQWKPVRDGWEPMGKTVTVKLGDCSKIDALDAPARSGRKEASEVAPSVRSAINEFVADVEQYVKSVSGSRQQIKRLGANTIGGHAISWGDDEERDIEGDFFDKNTDLWLDVYQNQPIMFDHASGIKLPDDPDVAADDQDMPRRYKLGHIVKAVKDDLGLWIEAVIDAHNDWVEGVWELVDKGALYFSSGSVPHLIKRTSGGEIKSWPVIEVSLTPTPAEPRRTRVAALRSTQGVDRVGDGQRHDSTSETDGDPREPAPITAMKSVRRKTTMRTKALREKRLGAFLDAYWDEDLDEAGDAIKAARRAANKKDATSDETAKAAAELKDAASQLDNLVGPIADQAKSALGIDAAEAKAMLYKMALGRIMPAKQIPYDDLDDGTMDGEFDEDDFTMDGDPSEEDYTMDGDPEQDDFMMDGDPDEDYLMDGDPDEDPYALSARPKRSGKRGGASRRNTRIRSRRSADIEAAVNRVMDRFGDEGGQRRAPGQMGVAQPGGLSGFIKAALNRDTMYLNRVTNRNRAAFKAMGINPDTAGGYLVPPEHSNEIIELLRANSVFIGETGAPNNLVTVLPMNRDTMTIPRQTGASTANWLGENSTISASQETLGQIQLVARKLAVLVKVSNELLADGTPDVDAFIRDDISKTTRLAVDRAVLYGDGQGSEPRGVYNSNLTYKTALNAAPTYDNLVTLTSQLEEANVDINDGSTQWILHPRDKNAFRSLQDGNGAYIFASGALTAGENATPKTLLDFPWNTTTQITKSANADPTLQETDVFFGHWKDVIVGMRKSIEIVASDVAGTSFESDQTWIRCILRLDVALRHPEAVAVYTDVRKVVTAP